jgi:hypothetical protein
LLRAATLLVEVVPTHVHRDQPLAKSLRGDKGGPNCHEPLRAIAFGRAVEGGLYLLACGDYGHELGLIDSRYAPASSAPGPGGALLYWHVDDVAAALERLLSMGAKQYEALTRRGEEGFVTASVVDPFGNVLGVMCNPHYLEVLGSIREA